MDKPVLFCEKIIISLQSVTLARVPAAAWRRFSTVSICKDVLNSLLQTFLGRVISYMGIGSLPKEGVITMPG